MMCECGNIIEEDRFYNPICYRCGDELCDHCDGVSHMCVHCDNEAIGGSEGFKDE